MGFFPGPSSMTGVTNYFLELVERIMHAKNHFYRILMNTFRTHLYLEKKIRILSQYRSIKMYEVTSDEPDFL